MLDKRLNEINNLINNIQDKNKEDLDNIYTSILKKYNKLLNGYIKVSGQDIDQGEVIRYVHKNGSKLSIAGIVVGIERNCNDYIKSLKLWSEIKNIYWIIKPEKYYIFKLVTAVRGNLRIDNNYIKKITNQ